MSRIAREITKKASSAALSAALLLQAVPVSAVETVNMETSNSVEVQETVEESEVVENTSETAVEEKSETVEKTEVLEDIEAPKTSEKIEVSEPAAGDVEIKADEDIVKIPDANLEKILRRDKNVPSTGDITKSDLAKVFEIKIKAEDNVKSLDGLEYCTRLKILTIEAVENLNLNLIKNSSSLQHLQITKSGVIDLNELSSFEELSRLVVDKVSNTNLDALKNMTKLNSIELFEAVNINDISAVANMKELYELRIRGNENTKSNLSDLSPIANLPELRRIDFSYTKVSDISVLATLPSLKNAILRYNEISKISDFYNALPDQIFAIIRLDGNMISDVDAIKTKKIRYQTAMDQNVTLPEMVTKAGDVTIKLPYDKNYLTEVQVDENEGKYNPDTNEITFFNVTSDRTVNYKIRLQDNFDSADADNINTESEGYDYSANITQPLRIGNVDETVDAPSESSGQTTAENMSAANTTVVKNENETAKTGDSGVLGMLSLAFMSLAGAVKTSRKRK